MSRMYQHQAFAPDAPLIEIDPPTVTGTHRNGRRASTRQGKKFCSVLPRFFSYGGGVQSTAMLVLAAYALHVRLGTQSMRALRALLPPICADLSDEYLLDTLTFTIFLFCNVGDDAENPATLQYVQDVAQPFAARMGLTLHELRRYRRDGQQETLWERLIKENSRSVPIPVRMDNGAPGNRTCTVDFKIRISSAEIKRYGATATQPAIVGLGISLDEFHRMRAASGRPAEQLVYPLIDLRLRRADCIAIIERAGVPVPPKSACFFCPFHSMAEWQRMKREVPDLYEKSVWLESLLNARRDRLGKDHVWLTRFAKPLDQAVGAGVQLEATWEEEMEVCVAASCYT